MVGITPYVFDGNKEDSTAFADTQPSTLVAGIGSAKGGAVPSTHSVLPPNKSSNNKPVHVCCHSDSSKGKKEGNFFLKGVGGDSAGSCIMVPCPQEAAASNRPPTAITARRECLPIQDTIGPRESFRIDIFSGRKIFSAVAVGGEGIRNLRRADPVDRFNIRTKLIETFERYCAASNR